MQKSKELSITFRQRIKSTNWHWKKKQCQRLGNTFEFDKTIKREKPTDGNCSNSNLIYNADHSYYKYYRDSKKIDNLSFKWKYSFQVEFFEDLNKLNNSNPQKESTKVENVNDNASELYNEYLEIYFDECKTLSDAQKRKLDSKCDPINLFLQT